MLDAGQAIDVPEGAYAVTSGPTRAFEGPRERLEERFEREALPHRSMLYAFAYRLTHNAADADDLVQETYLRAFRSFARYIPDSNIRAWLRTILYRARTDELRRGGRSLRTLPLLDDEEASVPPPQDSLAAGQEVLQRAVARLPEAFRAAVLLRDVQDMTYEEVSVALRIPIGTVMSRIHRGRALLRQALSPVRPRPFEPGEQTSAELRASAAL